MKPDKPKPQQNKPTESPPVGQKLTVNKSKEPVTVPNIMQLEGDGQMIAAAQKKRNEEEVLNKCLSALERFPEFAETVIYNKPVGRDEDTGVMKYATGLSIKAAEALRVRWGNNACGAQVVSEDDESVTLMVVYVDYELATKLVFAKRVSKYYKTKNGQIVKYTPDRFANNVLPAETSKAIREAILRSLPPEIKEQYSQKARQVMRKERPVARIEKMVAAFKELNVTPEQIENHIGKKLEQFTVDDIDRMQGIWVAIRDGESTVEEAFGGTDSSGQDDQPKMKVRQPQPQARQGDQMANMEYLATMEYFCDACGRLLTSTMQQLDGKEQCPYADCGKVGSIRKATPADYENLSSV